MSNSIQRKRPQSHLLNLKLEHLNMLKHETPKNDKKVNQVMKVQIYLIESRDKVTPDDTEIQETLETTMSNYMMITWKTWKKRTNS